MMEELSKLKIPANYDVQAVQDDFLRCKGQHYLDHAAATLYSDSQIRYIFKELEGKLFGNPHSRHMPSEASSEVIDEVRQRVLEHFNTTSKEYDIIFTSGATDACKIVGENFNWTSDDRRSSKEGNVQSMSNEPSNCKGAFLYQRENHTSVLGIRNYAEKFGAEVFSIPVKRLKKVLDEGIDTSLSKQIVENQSSLVDVEVDDTKRNCLFAYSPHCNFTGAKAPLDWIEKVQKGTLNSILDSSPINGDHKGRQQARAKWFVLLDAAGLVATCPLDLTKWKPDFVTVSFYKIFGYPTGIGCLLVNSRSWGMLKKSYYGGGTVLMVDSLQMTVVPRPVLHERFEDGTLPYLSIIALRHGFEILEKHTGGMKNIQHYVYNLARYTHHCLRSYRHANGNPVAKLYLQDDDSWSLDTHGSIVNFNLLESDGNFIGYAQVERMASNYDIHLRAGCLCNPGACQTNLDISGERLIHQFQAGHVCGDTHDLVDDPSTGLKLPTGSVRVSFGYMSTYKDAEQLLRMIRENFVDGCLKIDLSWMSVRHPSQVSKSLETSDSLVNGSVLTPSDAENGNVACDLDQPPLKGRSRIDKHNGNLFSASSSNRSNEPVLVDIVVYPVKSCGGMSVNRWQLGEEGLLYDRKWMVVTGNGMTVTQKMSPKMSLIKTLIDLENGMLTLSYEGEDDCSIPLRVPSTDDEDITLCKGKVCGDVISGRDCGQEVGNWLSRILDRPDLRLMRQINTRRRIRAQVDNGDEAENLSLANDSQYLLLNKMSVRNFLQEIDDSDHEELTEDDLVKRFRGNFIIDGSDAYEEDSWKSVIIDNINFLVQGPCMRCQMINVIPQTGQREARSLLPTLRTAKGSSTFGVHIKLSVTENDVPNGSDITISCGGIVNASC